MKRGMAFLIGWITLLGVASWGHAQAWVPYEPVEGHPHVVKGDEWGTFLPEPGWQFVDRGSEDLSVIPIPAKEIRVNTGGDPITIPAPQGFWTPEKGSLVAKSLKAQQSADEYNKTLGTWIRINDITYTHFQEATVKIQHQLNGNVISLSAFEEMRKMVVAESEKLLEKNREQLGQFVTNSSQKMAEKIGEDFNVTLLDLNVLPPHINDRDRLGSTLVKKTKISSAEGVLTNYTAVTTMLLWVRGTTISMALTKTTSIPSEVKEIVEQTRVALDAWVQEVDRINNRTSLEAENAIALAEPGCIKSSAEKQRERQKGNSLTRVSARVILVLIFTLVGGFLTWRDAIKKKRDPFVK